MPEAEAPRMKGLTRKIDGPNVVRTVDVALLADEGVASQPGLEPDLIALSRDETHFDQRGLIEPLDDAIVADGFLSSRIVGERLLLDERPLIPEQPVAPTSRWRAGMSVDHGQIDAFGFPAAELLFQAFLRIGILGKDDETGRVAIDSVNDQRPPFSARPQMLLHLVVDGWGLVPARQWHHQEPGGLVDDQQQRVFVDDFELASLSWAKARFRRAGPIGPHSHAIAHCQLHGGIIRTRL